MRTETIDTATILYECNIEKGLKPRYLRIYSNRLVVVESRFFLSGYDEKEVIPMDLISFSQYSGGFLQAAHITIQLKNGDVLRFDAEGVNEAKQASETINEQIGILPG